jgi:hypothetical protein
VRNAGRESDCNIAHPENTSDSIVSSSKVNAKVIDHSVKQSRRHAPPSKRTLLGIQIDFSEEHSESDRPGMSASRDSDSNVNDESGLQSEKHLDPKSSTDAGIQIDCREKHSKNGLSNLPQL